MKSFNRIRCLDRVVCEIIDEYKLSNAIVADIATDHGYLSELLSRNKKIEKIYATDISQKCLDKTNELIIRCNLPKIETRLGDGLDAIDGADIVVMAGIGGYEIINILSNQNITNNGENKCNIFVLQPTKNFAEVRRYLFRKDVRIVRDFIVKSGGKFYPIIVVDLAKINNLNIDIFNTYFGKDNNLTNPDFVEYLFEQETKLNFLDSLDENTISEDLRIKNEIYQLVKELIKKYKGD